MIALPSSPAILRAIRKLELRTRGFVESLFSGEYSSVFHGRGAEFSHVRAYQPGDDIRTIDWKVTARRGAPFVREFVEERDLHVALVVDVSASARLGPGARSIGEVATEIAAALAFAANRKNDRISLLLVSDRVECVVRPGSGQRHVVRLLTALLSHEAEGTGTDLARGLDALARSAHGRATVFLVSDFIDVGDRTEFREVLGRVCRKHDVIAVRLSGDVIADLPDAGWVEMRDPETGRRAVLDTGNRVVRQRYRKAISRAEAETAALLTETGAELLDVDLAGDPILALTDFFRRRRRAS